MKKIINLLLVVIFSITTYNISFRLNNGVNGLWVGSFAVLAFGIIKLLITNENAESIAEEFTKQILKKHRIYIDDKWHSNTIKLKGSISNHQEFFSFESDAFIKTTKIFGYHAESCELKNLSYFVGLKRETVLYKDYTKSTNNWVSGYGDSHGCNIFFVIQTTESRRLLSYDLNKNDAHYESLDKTRYPATLIEVYCR